ncbi:RepB family plasmid replication initiator protein [Parashewanella curva]|uniref:RepB family plasmid replication initiator protein n=1 Tax=Parashewanella curva TaxID=2338552 RepID=A0A3L8PSS9_9GAMM|nr:replication initiation protein [Parashewanella curva]RLV57879.1 RepB family plasmid replication initiator protein [Parashewanella curva]
MNNLSVTKSNYLIDASYKLNTQAQKLVLACLGKVDPRAEIPKEMTLTASEYAELMGVKHNARRDLYKAADALFDAVITITDETETRRVRWIQADVKKHKGEGSVTIQWSDNVLKYISELKSRFTTYKLRHIAELQSAHSIRLYELLMKFNSTGERVIYLDDFKSALGISDKYPEFKILKRAVIKPAVEELNQRSDLIIKYETIKQGRSVIALGFEFKQNKQMKLDV